MELWKDVCWASRDGIEQDHFDHLKGVVESDMFEVMCDCANLDDSAARARFWSILSSARINPKRQRKVRQYTRRRSSGTPEVDFSERKIQPPLPSKPHFASIPKPIPSYRMVPQAISILFDDNLKVMLPDELRVTRSKTHTCRPWGTSEVVHGECFFDRDAGKFVVRWNNGSTSKLSKQTFRGSIINILDNAVVESKKFDKEILKRMIPRAWENLAKWECGI